MRKKTSGAKGSKNAFASREVEAVFKGYPEELRRKLLFLRELIFDTALTTHGVGRLEEALKWGQPSYLTTETGSGSTVRMDAVKAVPGQYAIYFHCQTDLVATFRELYPTQLNYGGNRSILLHVNEDVPEETLRHCVSLALTYHQKKKQKRPKL